MTDGASKNSEGDTQKKRQGKYTFAEATVQVDGQRTVRGSEGTTLGGPGAGSGVAAVLVVVVVVVVSGE